MKTKIELTIKAGSMLDLFIKSIAKNPNHAKYDLYKKLYPSYFKN